MKKTKLHLPARKNMLLAFALMLCVFVFSETKAQNNPNTIYKEWVMLGESATHVDVSCRIVKCGLTTPNQIHLSVFNESASAQTTNMTIVVKNNATNTSFSTQISYTSAVAALVKADCSSSTSTNSLKIDLPAGYDPNNLTVTITFN